MNSSSTENSVDISHHQTHQEPKLFIPQLQSLYALLEPLSWLIVRCACGLILAVHGWGKIVKGAEVVAPNFEKLGFYPALEIVYLLIFVEFFGGLCVALGLFTRFFAAAITIEMGVIFFTQYLPNGFSWLNRGYEFVLLWGLIALAITVKGGGPLSLDRKIGREL